MYKVFFYSILFGLLGSSCSNSHEAVLQLMNPMKQNRSDASILLSRGEIGRWLDIPEGQLPVLKGMDGAYLPCQADDLDGDGLWDELFALATLEAEESLKISVQFLPAEEYPVFPARTAIHLGDAQDNYRELSMASRLEGISYHNYTGITEASYQMEGVAWENDIVGFRNYLDQRNGMDIFGKTTPEMVLAGVGKKGGSSYHESADWGMDVLKVGTSLGAGGIACMFNDSLYRVGDNGSGTFRLVFQGPLRSRFRLDYTDWLAGEEKLHVSHQVDIVAGRHCYESLVTYEGTEEKLALVPGIVNMGSDSLYVIELNEQYTALLTHDHQSEDGSLLAMALLVPSLHLLSSGETVNEGSGITQTYYASLDASPREPVSYRFYAFWEKEDPRWSSRDEIIGHLQAEAERLVQSVIYSNAIN